MENLSIAFSVFNRIKKGGQNIDGGLGLQAQQPPMKHSRFETPVSVTMDEKLDSTTITET